MARVRRSISRSFTRTLPSRCSSRDLAWPGQGQEEGHTVSSPILPSHAHTYPRHAFPMQASMHPAPAAALIPPHPSPSPTLGSTHFFPFARAPEHFISPHTHTRICLPTHACMCPPPHTCMHVDLSHATTYAGKHAPEHAARPPPGLARLQLQLLSCLLSLAAPRAGLMGLSLEALQGTL